MKTDVHADGFYYIKILSLFLTENTAIVNYNTQWVNVVKEKTCVYCETNDKDVNKLIGQNTYFFMFQHIVDVVSTWLYVGDVPLSHFSLITRSVMLLIIRVDFFEEVMGVAEQNKVRQL